MTTRGEADGLVGTDVTFRTYPTDHSGTMTASLPGSLPFARQLFRR